MMIKNMLSYFVCCFSYASAKYDTRNFWFKHEKKEEIEEEESEEAEMDYEHKCQLWQLNSEL